VPMCPRPRAPVYPFLAINVVQVFLVQDEPGTGPLSVRINLLVLCSTSLRRTPTAFAGGSTSSGG